MVVPTYPEGGSHALQVCQHHLTTIRLCECRQLCRVGRDSKNMLLATAPANSAETFTVPQRTARSMVPWGWRAVARPSTRALCFFALNRMVGTNSTEPRAGFVAHLVRTFCRSPTTVPDASAGRSRVTICYLERLLFSDKVMIN